MDQVEFAIVITTAGSRGEADSLSKELLKRKLAACIQVGEINSYYAWKEKVCIDREFQLLIKSRAGDFTEIEKLIRSRHSYDLPEIIQIPITNGAEEYLDWVIKETRQGASSDPAEERTHP